MGSSLRDKLADLLTRRWYLVLLAWLAIALSLRSISPRWDAVVKDGDFDYLPADSPSRSGMATLRHAFPDDLSRSQLVVVFANTSSQFSVYDRCTMFDVARRLTWYVGKVKLNRLLESKIELTRDSPPMEHLRHVFDAAIEFDVQWFEAMREVAGADSPLASRRLIAAYRDRMKLAELVGDKELASNDQQTIQAFESMSSRGEVEALPLNLASSFEDLWTWLDPVLSKNLGAEEPHIKLLAIQMREEFMAVRNLEIVDALQHLIGECKDLSRRATSESSKAVEGDMRIELTGATAVGADLLAAAKFSVSQSEVYTVFAVVMTLLLIYRSPLLVFLPLLTIGIAFSVSSNVLSLVAGLSDNFQSTPLVQLYSTTRIFLIVLIFGIGTDLTLFFIVRCRESFFRSANSDLSWHQVVASSWCQVFGAIVGSGLTTAIGLSMMAVSSFAKFRYSGIAISASIIITLIVCITLPVAILTGLGPKAFWPANISENRSAKRASASARRESWIWTKLADLIVSRPFAILSLTVVILAVPSMYGWYMMNKVTYNFVGELSTNATSRQGQSLVKQFLPRIETSAITLCVTAEKPFEDEGELRRAIEKYRQKLFVTGVVAVQTWSDPLGEFPPNKPMGLLSKDAWRRRMLQNHPLAQQKFSSHVEELKLKVARFEIVTHADPFSDEAAAVLSRIQQRNDEIQRDDSSLWKGSRSAISGVTASIVDLKKITQHDQMMVQIFVTLSVLIVLLILIRRLELSVYLMFSVLFSYFATLGISQALFGYLYGNTFEGLDWKVPLFLFVILVAVGQDYNIYLTTRILEEQHRLGARDGLKHAIVITGGIITSCGLIMFATFAAMCWGSIHLQTGVTNDLGWPIPALRGIGELGFALSFGILLDTFIIRTIIVPAYIAWRKLT